MPLGPSASERAAADALRAAGFLDVRFIPARPDERTADLLGERDGELWAIEVRQATRGLREDASFEPASDGRPLPYPTLVSYLALLWAEKRAQLEATSRAHGCGRAMLLVVVRGDPAPAWSAALVRAHAQAGRPSACFALACAGRLLIEPAAWFIP